MVKEHNNEYPTLPRIAYELFVIPCSSAQPERVFSGYLVILDLKINCRCGLTITDLRSRLLPDVVEAIECLQWWMKGGFLDDGRISLEDE
jgi:hAT family C-terminal dimerisation region